MKNSRRNIVSALLACGLIGLSAAANAAIAPQKAGYDAARFSIKPSAKAKVFAEPSENDYKTYAKFRSKTSQSWQATFSPRTAIPDVLKGGTNLKYSGDAESAARSFLSENKDFLKVDPSRLRLSLKSESMGVRHLIFQQYENGLPVHDGTVKIHIADDGEVAYYQSRFAPDAWNVSPSPSLSGQSAGRIASSDSSGKADVDGAALVYYPDDNDGKVHLAWKIQANGSDSNRWVYLIDAGSGQILLRYSARFLATSGRVTGQVFALFPQTRDFTDYTTLPMRNQYVWIQTPDRVATTDADGNYSYSSYDGRIFTSLQGPYFSVVSMRDKSAHYDNGGGVWAGVSVSSGSPHPYAAGQIYSSTVTVHPSAVKVMPHFAAGFQVGEMDTYANLNIPDQLYISNPNGKNLAAYTTQRDLAFFGAPVTGSSYTVTLVASRESPGTETGYQIDFSSYLYLTQTGASPGTASFVWQPAYIPYGDRVEANIFYHLNEMRAFFYYGVDGANQRPADLNFLLPVMAHAHGAPDSSTEGMLNAAYDSERKTLMFGDGAYDGSISQYRSFGLDATIIRHEYVHAAHDRICPLLYYGESGAISEAVADYWSLSSLRNADATLTPVTNKFGEFLQSVFGEGVVRNLMPSGCDTGSANCKKLSGWRGEIHDDSLIISQALWQLRHSASTTTFLGLDSYQATYAGSGQMPIADFLVWNALFFFPDSFTQFKDAMDYVTRKYYAYDDSKKNLILSKISLAFADHGIVNLAGGDAYEPNNGSAVATNGTTIAPVSATIYPAFDVDYYSAPVPAGPVKVTLKRPSAGDGIYHVYLPMILDTKLKVVARIENPDIGNPTWSGNCPASGICYSTQEKVSLEFTAAENGRYYFVVAAGPNDDLYNCATTSTEPYTLTFDYALDNSARGERINTVFDGDVIEFSARYSKYYYNDYSGTAPAWVPSTMTACLENFAYAQLRDNNMRLLDDTKATSDTPGTYLKVKTDPVRDETNLTLDGKVELLPGFAARYPALGTVYLEIFANVRGASLTSTNSVVSLGISSPINLAGKTNEVVIWNNLFNPAKGQKATVKYEFTGQGSLSLKVYTPDGMLVKEIYSGSVVSGKGNALWDGRNSHGDMVASGVYYLRIDGPSFTDLQKMVVIH
ncbi:MAG: hypothetical protein WCS77_02180 [Elusimicrobiaceae bacterium]